MELKDKYKLLLQMFDAKEGEHFSDTIDRVLQAKNRDEYFDKYIEVFPDLSKDELRSCWQFWFADRSEKMQDYTPEPLADLCANLLLMFEGKSLYDCCSGSGALTIATWSKRKELTVQCEELDEKVIPLLLFNLAVRNISGEVINGNVLSGVCNRSWVLTKGEKYSTVQAQMFPNEIKADLAISNPPYNIRSGGKNMNFEFVRKCINASNRAVILLPGGTKTSQDEVAHRVWLCDKQYLQAVVDMPSGMFESTGIPVSIYVLDKREKDCCYLVDASNSGEKYIREQRGEGDRSHTERIYKKEMVRFNDHQMAAIQQMTEREAGLSTRVMYKDMIEKKYSFQRGNYLDVEIDDSHSTHRAFTDIINDINRIAKLRNTMKVTVNQVWAKQLHLDVLLQLHKENEDLTKNITEQLHSLGIKTDLILPNYIAETASKELKIVQVDKEILSPVLQSFIPFWAQHIRTMNDMETLLLQELRDALLEPLMTGRIQFEDNQQAQPSEQTNKNDNQI
jgi:type I restriction-modification system DNA methylase subunit